MYREQDVIVNSRAEKSKLFTEDSQCGLADAMVKNWMENFIPADSNSFPPSSDDKQISIATKTNEELEDVIMLPSTNFSVSEPFLNLHTLLGNAEARKSSRQSSSTGPRNFSERKLLSNSVVLHDEDKRASPKVLFDKGDYMHRNKKSTKDTSPALINDVKIGTPVYNLENTANAGSSVEMENVKSQLLKNEYLAQTEVINNTKSMNKFNKGRVDSKSENRQKRGGQRERKICSLLLKSDVSLWDYMTGPTESGGLGYKNVRASQEIIALFDLMVSGAQDIFDTTVLETDELGPYTGITFAIYGIEINTTWSCSGKVRKSNPFCPANLGVSSVLSFSSMENHNKYCLSLVVTYRNFGDGTLGLAFVGYPDRIPGGICERYRPIREKASVTSRSLNTGVMTLNNYGRRVTSAVSIITLTHEIGHSFGATHDEPESFCAPASNSKHERDPRGNYLMYSLASRGDLANNKKFSSCSIKSMTELVDAILNRRNGKYNCFMEIDVTDAGPSGEGASAGLAASYCGNRRVEAREQCDCGLAEECLEGEFKDECCHPHNDTQYRCTLRPTAQCSPSQGICCKHTCQMARRMEFLSCSTETECTYESFCDGRSAQCPSPYWKPDLTACNRRTQVCINGTCSRSICLTFGWTACTPDQSTAAEDHYGSSRLCQLSCRNPITNLCINTGDQHSLDQPENEPLRSALVKQKVRLEPGPPTLYVALVPDDEPIGLFLPPGTPCNEGLGYCDMFHRCKALDMDGPLKHIMGAFLGGEENTRNSFSTWIGAYWWALFLAGVGFILIAILIALVFSVNTPSSRPSSSPDKAGSYHSSMDSSNQDSIPGLDYSGMVMKRRPIYIQTSTELKPPVQSSSSNRYYWTANEKVRRAPNRGTASFLGSITGAQTFYSFSPPSGESPVMITKSFSLNFSEEYSPAPLQYRGNEKPILVVDSVDNKEADSNLSDNDGEANWSTSSSGTVPDQSENAPQRRPENPKEVQKEIKVDRNNFDKEFIGKFHPIQIEDLIRNNHNDNLNKNTSKSERVAKKFFKFPGDIAKYDDHVNKALPGVEYARTAM